MTTQEHQNADEVLIRKRFSDLRDALRRGAACQGVCPMHGTMTDSQILQLEAIEAIMVDVKNIRADITQYRNDVTIALNRQNAVAGAEIELEQKVGMMAKAAKVLHPVTAVAVAAAVIVICITVLKLKG